MENLGSLFGGDVVVNDDGDAILREKEDKKSSICEKKKELKDESKADHTNQEVRVAMIGNVDSGKSTLIGVLCGGQLDDGRGKARSSVFTHAHESSSGRTSAVSHQLIGFDEKDKQVFVNRKQKGKRLGKGFWNELVDRSTKQVVLIDLCGHRKYLKTTIFGLTGLSPDYAIVLIGSNMGIPRMTREHIGIACALKIPIIVVITKIDICPANIFKQTMTKLKRILRNRQKMPFVVNKPKKVTKAVELLTTSSTSCPVFITSNVTGKGIDELRSFIGKLSKPVPLLTASDFDQSLKNCTDASPPSSPLSSLSTTSSTLALDDAARRRAFEMEMTSRPTVFSIDSTFLVPGVGLVLSGNVRQGSIKLNDHVLLGPSKTGEFRKVLVRGIHANRVAREMITAGKSASIAIRSLKKKHPISRESVRKGMVCLSEKIDPEFQMTWKFEAEVLILHHQTTCGMGYAPVIHCGVVRQSAKILSITKIGTVTLPGRSPHKTKIKTTTVNANTSSGNDKENKNNLRTGDRAVVEFEFCYFPEFLEIGSQMLFREGRAKGIGKITKIGGRSAGRTLLKGREQ